MCSSVGSMWRKLFCFMQQVLYCSVSETAPDTQRMRSWADPIANVDTVEKREISGKLFSVSPGCSVFTLQIVPGMHLVTFIRIVEKDKVCY